MVNQGLRKLEADPKIKRMKVRMDEQWKRNTIRNKWEKVYEHLMTEKCDTEEVRRLYYEFKLKLSEYEQGVKVIYRMVCEGKLSRQDLCEMDRVSTGLIRDSEDEMREVEERYKYILGRNSSDYPAHKNTFTRTVSESQEQSLAFPTVHGSTYGPCITVKISHQSRPGSIWKEQLEFITNPLARGWMKGFVIFWGWRTSLSSVKVIPCL